MATREPKKRLLKRRLPQILLGVLAVYATIPIWAPGPEWLWFLVGAGLLVAAALISREMARLVLGLLARIFPPIDYVVHYERRRQDFGEVVGKMDLMLSQRRQPHLPPEILEGLAEHPPHEPEDDIAVCSERFAKHLFPEDDRASAKASWLQRILFWRSSAEGLAGRSPMAEVLRILYLDAQGESTEDLWRRATKKHRDAIAKILAESGRLPELDESQPRKERIRWVLDRLPREYREKVVGEELAFLHRLWSHLSEYSDFLHAAGILADFDVARLHSEVDRKIGNDLLVSRAESAAAEILIETSGELLESSIALEGALPPDATPLSPQEVKALALVGLGICTTQSSGSDPLVLRELGLRVARNGTALNMLLAYLWKKSHREDTRASPSHFAALVEEWRTWYEQATVDMGTGVEHEMSAVLKASLKKGEWPPWLPIQQTISTIIHQSQQSYALLTGLRDSHQQDAVQRAKIEKLLAWTGEKLDGTEDGDRSELIQKLERAVEKKLRALLPQSQIDPAMAKRRVGPEDLKHKLENFAGEFKSETGRPSYFRSYSAVFDILAHFRERADELARRLDELDYLLRAEAAGGSAYVITFDQVRGSLADLIDSLAEKYGFLHYTRYSRIGLLPSDETFENFYRRLEADLATRISEAVEEAERGRSPVQEDAGEAGDESGREWVQIEITVQQISLFHRYDFVDDAKKLLKDQLTEPLFSKVFRVPPSSTALLGWA